MKEEEEGRHVKSSEAFTLWGRFSHNLSLYMWGFFLSVLTYFRNLCEKIFHFHRLDGYFSSSVF